MYIYPNIYSSSASFFAFTSPTTCVHGRRLRVRVSGDTTPCRMTGATLHSHVRYTEI